MMINMIIIKFLKSKRSATFSQALFLTSFSLYPLADLPHKPGNSFIFSISFSLRYLAKRSSLPNVFRKKDFRKDFAKFTGKHQCGNTACGQSKSDNLLF